MNYNDKDYHYDQCNYPDEWNCDCDRDNNKQVFYGYFVATDKGYNRHDNRKENNTKNENWRKQEDYEKEQNTRPCQEQNTRRCCCPFCTLFRGCRK